MDVGLIGGNSMKKKAVTFTIFALAMVVLVLATFNMASVRASSNYGIESVNHTVGVLYNGYVLINDTIALSGQTGSFLLCFPHAFGPSVIQAIAYSTNDTSNVFPVALNVPLEDHAGFYGVQVDFPDGNPQVFSVVFVLSNSLLSQDSSNATMFTLVFPAFPSLTEATPVCNSSVVVPGAQYLNGNVSDFTYDAENLSAFTYNSSQITFLLSGGNVQIFEIKQLTREVDINEFGHTRVSDSYFVTNNSTQAMNSVEVVVPPNASNIDSRDATGRSLAQPALIDVNPTLYQINFTQTLPPKTAARFAVSYDLPDDIYVRKQEGNNFAVDMTFFQDTNSYIDQASVNFVLPQGARLASFGTTLAGNSYSVERDVRQETMTVSQQNIISLDSFAVSLSYDYSPLWLAFGPTMWVWALTIVGAVVVVAWKRPKTPSGVIVPSAGLRLRPEDVRSFVDAYDEKVKIESEIDLLEAKVLKGKIPRRRYKVQKKTLEIRLETLDRTLAELGGKIHSAGGHYSDLMRQLEVAETEIDGVEANMKSIEARQARGEISLETYRKLLGDYERRKDRARTTIKGILLRLREEIR
jgi:hypothetical protein